MLGDAETLIVIGPTPPPIHGTAFTTPHVVEAVEAAGRLAAHLDTSDPRPVLTSGRLDARNAWLGVLHAAQLTALLLRHRDAAVFVPISQVRWGFIRDAVFIWLAALFRRRVIVHLNGGLFRTFARDSGAAMRLLITRTMRHVDEAWVLTPAHMNMFEGLVEVSKVAVLQNTAADQGLDGDGSEDAASPEPTRRVLYLSNLLPEKGCLDLLAAVEALGEDARGLELRFAGEADPAVLEELMQRAEALSRRGVIVRYEGTLMGAEKAAAFHWAQVFALPSRYPPEGQPLSLLEALSAGVPVISTTHSGIPYTVRDGEEGLLVPPGDVGAIAAAIRILIADPDLRIRLGEAARRRYVDCYRPEVFRAAVAELLLGPDSAKPGASAQSSALPGETIAGRD